MADLAADAAVEQVGDSRFRARLSRDWSVWGPNGGYLASVALRAAAAVSRLPRPASMSCQFLRVADYGEVDVEVEVLHRSQRAESLRVRLTQRGRPVLESAVWALPGSVPGPAARWSAPPEIPDPASLPTLHDSVAAEGHPVLPIWLSCIEVRLAGAHDEGPDRPARDPVVHGWVRLRSPAAWAEDPWLDACRAVLAVDLAQFPAVTQGLPARELVFVAPSLDLWVAFHDPAAGAEWLLLEARGVAAGGGLVSARAAVWTPDGRLVATGAQQMLVRGGARPTAPPPA